jgi:hypothetical protein
MLAETLLRVEDRSMTDVHPITLAILGLAIAFLGVVVTHKIDARKYDARYAQLQDFVLDRMPQ